MSPGADRRRRQLPLRRPSHHEPAPPLPRPGQAPTFRLPDRLRRRGGARLPLAGPPALLVVPLRRRGREQRVVRPVPGPDLHVGADRRDKELRARRHHRGRQLRVRLQGPAVVGRHGRGEAVVRRRRSRRAGVPSGDGHPGADTAPEPGAHAGVLRRRPRPRAHLRVPGERQPGPVAPRAGRRGATAAAAMAGSGEDHARCGGGVGVPARRLPAGGDPPRHQGQQRAARRGFRGADHRLRAGAGGGGAPDPRLDAGGGDDGVHGAGEPGGGNSGHAHGGRLQLRNTDAGGGDGAAAEPDGATGGRRRGGGRAGTVGPGNGGAGAGPGGPGPRDGGGSDDGEPGEGIPGRGLPLHRGWTPRQACHGRGSRCSVPALKHQ